VTLSAVAVAAAYVDFVRGASDELVSLMADDFHDTVSGRHGPAVWDTVRAWMEASFSDLVVELHAAAADGDRVLVWVTVHGTHVGSAFPWMEGRPATGRRVAWHQLHVFRLGGEQIVEHWAVRDDLRVLQAIDAR
jgi:predicted ester cyclase